ncbi:DUF5107 domain-containing protein [Demequina sp. NBRC 110055]|uniref:DUF5107 domain-containing protein n=1 Tax=Demequina sp. NBRC 110055 TaxID=1570344 RepID=UPI00135652D6|nr:DUF5107 domain-containing protein [Demequina sp. NBRC 110055]
MNAGPERIVLPEAAGADAEALAAGGAVAWEEPVTIRTYEAGEPCEYPLYLDRRVYQGSSGKVYPLPFTESVAETPVARDWQAVHLENAYVRLMILPELGGRIHIGYDKTTGYDFFYRNNVIKPALVGLAGPWVSGGVEFNWPQHHRPATYLPVETLIEHDADGSVTVWCYDHDPFARMSAQHGIRLRPDSSVIELAVRAHNRSSERQTFLWWSNVAARVHDDYQSFFPEDVRYVADHARRALTAFPQADRPYYNVDYPALAAEQPGADRLDFYRNIPAPTSYMIVDTHDDFFGGYDHAAGAGFVHWAERRVSPGKKQWTWGNAPFGHAWDDQLTDGDGPYVELMAGVYTDNQPDFSWLLPGETKTFSQYWYPIPGIGPAHQATPDAAVNVSGEETINATFAVTAVQRGARARVLSGSTVVNEEVVDLSPGDVVTLAAEVRRADAVVELRDASGSLLVRWQAPVVADEEPWVASEPPAPAATPSVDELYLTGVHLAQYRHPTRRPETYWDEALERDPGHVPTLVAVADRLYRAGRYEEARDRVERALARLTRRNANPADAEAFYLAGLIYARLGRDDEAERAWGKAGWDGTWTAAAGLELARSLARHSHHRAALRVLDSLDGVVGHDARRAAVRAVVLRAMGRGDEADAVLSDALEADVLEATLRALAGHALRADPSTRLDVALDLARAGDIDGALAQVDAAVAVGVTGAGNVTPIAQYLAAWMLERAGRSEEAAARREAARVSDRRLCFPAGLDAHDALVAAIAAEPADAVARSLLGMLLYGAGRRVEAAALWEEAIALGLDDPLTLRNAGLAAHNVTHDDALAWRRYGEAVAQAPGDARLLFERDQLAARLGHPASDRLAALQPLRDLVLTRDDLTIEFVDLLTAAGRADEALAILQARAFHPWEGGEGKALAAWDQANAALGHGVVDPPRTLGEARPRYAPPPPVRDDGVIDYFATSLPDLLLFVRE